MNSILASFALLFVAGCGCVAEVPDAGRDAAPDVQPDAPRLFCSPAVGPVDASAPNPPAIYECTKPGERCWLGPNAAFVCCQPDGGTACFPP